MQNDADNQINEIMNKSPENKIINLNDESNSGRKKRRKKLIKKKKSFCGKKRNSKQKKKFMELNLDEDDKDILNMLNDDSEDYNSTDIESD